METGISSLSMLGNCETQAAITRALTPTIYGMGLKESLRQMVWGGAGGEQGGLGR